MPGSGFECQGELVSARLKGPSDKISIVSILLGTEYPLITAVWDTSD